MVRRARAGHRPGASALRGAERGRRPRAGDRQAGSRQRGSGGPADRRPRRPGGRAHPRQLRARHRRGRQPRRADPRRLPKVTILATSREPLRITGEVLWPVAPLPVPPEGESEVGQFAAVRLLEDRVTAVRPGFAVDAGNAAAVARLCRALDGMPLAIELAAPWLRTLTRIS